MATQNLVTEVADVRKNVETDHEELIKELKTENKKLKKENKKMGEKMEKMEKKMEEKMEKMEKRMEKRIEKMEKEIEKKEACQNFLFQLKDLATYKTLAQKIRDKKNIDHHEDRIVEELQLEEKGTKKVKSNGIQGYFDTKNCVGHKIMTISSVDDCIKVLQQYPDMPTLYDVACSNEETFEFLESCRGCVEEVKLYAQLNLSRIQKKTLADKIQQRNERRKESIARKKARQSI